MVDGETKTLMVGMMRSMKWEAEVVLLLLLSQVSVGVGETVLLGIGEVDRRVDCGC